MKRTAAKAAVTLDIVARVRIALAKPSGRRVALFEEIFASVFPKERQTMSRRSRVLTAIIIALAVMVGLIAWAYTVAEHKIR